MPAPSRLLSPHSLWAVLSAASQSSDSHLPCFSISSTTTTTKMTASPPQSRFPTQISWQIATASGYSAVQVNLFSLPLRFVKPPPWITFNHSYAPLRQPAYAINYLVVQTILQFILGQWQCDWLLLLLCLLLHHLTKIVNLWQSYRPRPWFNPLLYIR